MKRGDGLVFDSGAPEGEEEGGTIFEMRHDHTSSGGGSDAVLSFGQGQVDVGRVKARSLITKSASPRHTCKQRLCQCSSVGHSRV